jgi:hypothetical protein
MNITKIRGWGFYKPGRRAVGTLDGVCITREPFPATSLTKSICLLTKGKIPFCVADILLHSHGPPFARVGWVSIFHIATETGRGCQSTHTKSGNYSSRWAFNSHISIRLFLMCQWMTKMSTRKRYRKVQMISGTKN